MVRDHQKDSMRQDRPLRSSCCTLARPSYIPAAARQYFGHYSRDRECCRWRGGFRSNKNRRVSSESASVVRCSKAAEVVLDIASRGVVHWRGIGGVFLPLTAMVLWMVQRELEGVGSSSVEVDDTRLDQGQKAFYTCAHNRKHKHGVMDGVLCCSFRR